MEPFIGEIRLFAFGMMPRGWAACNGQLLSIQQNQALFSLLGNTYGGDGRSTFALPDLRGKVPAHVGASIRLGETAGEESHALAANEMPSHLHQAIGSSDHATDSSPEGSVWAVTSEPSYAKAASGTMSPEALAPVGKNNPHPNMQPYLAMNYCIALQGIYPTRN